MAGAAAARLGRAGATRCVPRVAQACTRAGGRLRGRGWCPRRRLPRRPAPRWRALQPPAARRRCQTGRSRVRRIAPPPNSRPRRSSPRPPHGGAHVVLHMSHPVCDSHQHRGRGPLRAQAMRAPETHPRKTDSRRPKRAGAGAGVGASDPGGRSGGRSGGWHGRDFTRRMARRRAHNRVAGVDSVPCHSSHRQCGTAGAATVCFTSLWRPVMNYVDGFCRRRAHGQPGGLHPLRPDGRRNLQGRRRSDGGGLLGRRRARGQAHVVSPWPCSARPARTVVFSWITWPSRQVRDEAFQEVDGRPAHETPKPTRCPSTASG